MDTRLLKYFESIVRNKNITKAANELYISQPTLSTQIKILEQELGCKLLERTTREITLTEAGEVLYKHALQILNQLDVAEKEMLDVKDIGLGEIVIGVTATNINWLGTVLLKFRTKYPQLPIKLREMSTEGVVEGLRSYEIHIGLMTDAVTTDFLNIKPIFEDKMVLVTSNPALRSIDEISLADIPNEPLILFPQGYHTRQLIMDAYSEIGIHPNVAIEVDRTTTILNFVALGLGSSLVFKNFLKDYDQNHVHILSLQKPTIKRTMYIATHQNRYLPKAIYDIQNLVVDAFK